MNLLVVAAAAVPSVPQGQWEGLCADGIPAAGFSCRAMRKVIVLFQFEHPGYETVFTTCKREDLLCKSIVDDIAFGIRYTNEA